VPVSSRALVEFVLLGPTNDRRQLQDTPILGDVWVEFASKPAEPVDLLISPYRTRPAGPVASKIAERLAKLGMSRGKGQEAHVAYLQGIVAARLYFSEVLRIIVPMTDWWRQRNVEEGLRASARTLPKALDAILDWARADDPDVQDKLAQDFAGFNALERYAALAGLILWAGNATRGAAPGKGIGGLIDHSTDSGAVLETLTAMFTTILEDARATETPGTEPMVWQVSLNRKAMPALERSVAAVKADAARTLFKVKCDEIGWAVIDSGIDATHPVFNEPDGRCRIEKTLDFTNIRQIVSLDNLNTDGPEFQERLSALLKWHDPNDPAKRAEAARDLQALAQDADNDRPINWGLVARFVEIPRETPPSGGHGTHVAGIIGANGHIASGSEASPSSFADGMCPDIRLYDFRVLGKTLQDTEFAIIAALQYIRYLNERHSFFSVHGANLSLSIPHDVRNFACGRTPVCNECERLVDSSVVVVAAAGNLGYHSFETKDGSYEGYTAFSITDPGNADGVITVGATHRFWPHTYGISFFSSRGPTGDGRMKPDLVAPGERIQSSLPEKRWGELDGTSMAAPHVSGAAAMLMGRYSELIGQPRRIKRILCESATDLGRERSFQGHGMLDVLRAFQMT
jgi:hypothetical protein